MFSIPPKHWPKDLILAMKKIYALVVKNFDWLNIFNRTNQIAWNKHSRNWYLDWPKFKLIWNVSMKWHSYLNLLYYINTPISFPYSKPNPNIACLTRYNIPLKLDTLVGSIGVFVQPTIINMPSPAPDPDFINKF